jgi:hypothetical protein
MYSWPTIALQTEFTEWSAGVLASVYNDTRWMWPPVAGGSPCKGRGNSLASLGLWRHQARLMAQVSWSSSFSRACLATAWDSAILSLVSGWSKVRVCVCVCVWEERDNKCQCFTSLRSPDLFCVCVVVPGRWKLLSRSYNCYSGWVRSHVHCHCPYVHTPHALSLAVSDNECVVVPLWTNFQVASLLCILHDIVRTCTYMHTCIYRCSQLNSSMWSPTCNPSLLKTFRIYFSVQNTYTYMYVRVHVCSSIITPAGLTCIHVHVHVRGSEPRTLYDIGKYLHVSIS